MLKGWAVLYPSFNLVPHADPYQMVTLFFLFAAIGTLAFPWSVAALISFTSLYFYELPTHHCPFCILQREYNYVGYLIYLTLMEGGIACAGAWALMPFRSVPSLREYLPRIQRRLTGAGLTLYGAFTAVVIFRVLFSDFILTPK